MSASQNDAMSASENCDDPWQTPAAELDAELLETSQHLMAKSAEQFPQPEQNSPSPELEIARQRITELELQLKRISHRNARLTAEAAQLRAAKQRLTQELTQYQQPSRPAAFGWLRKIWPR